MKYLKTSLYLAGLFLVGCSATSLESAKSELGINKGIEEMTSQISEPGIILFEKHIAANWAVERSGLLNLNHPKAVAADLLDRAEPIALYVYTVTHPKYGTFIIDSGISEQFINVDDNTDVSFIVKQAMNTDALEVVKTTKVISEEIAGGIQGAFLTHIHLDHIMGLKDLADGTPVYIGPGDAGMSSAMNAFTQGTTDRLLGTVESLREWPFEKLDGQYSGLIDIFGDGSIWAIHSPGHTPGSTAYLIRSTEGPQLVTGDVCHTRWGWENNVEPGSYTMDHEQNVVSLNALQQLASDYPSISVHAGHQSL